MSNKIGTFSASITMNEYIDFHDYRAVIESEEISAKISGIGGGVVPMLETSEEVAREQPT